MGLGQRVGEAIPCRGACCAPVAPGAFRGRWTRQRRPGSAGSPVDNPADGPSQRLLHRSAGCSRLRTLPPKPQVPYAARPWAGKQRLKFLPSKTGCHRTRPTRCRQLPQCQAPSPAAPGPVRFPNHPAEPYIPHRPARPPSARRFSPTRFICRPSLQCAADNSARRQINAFR